MAVVPELIVKLKDRELSRVPILRRVTKVGRDADNDVVIDNIGVSRYHATVEYDGDRFVVKDAGSENGIFVNGQLIGRHRLNNGDEVQVGKFTVVFSVGGGVAPDKLMRDSPLVEEPRDSRMRNPLKTTALTSDELKRFMKEKLGQDGFRAPARTTRPQAPQPNVRAELSGPVPPRPAPTPAPAAPFMQQPTMQAANAAKRLEAQARTFRNIALVLGFLVVALIAVTLFLVVTGK